MQDVQKVWLGAPLPGRGHDEEGQCRQVLEQQDARREPTVLAAELALVGQLLERDRG